MKEPYRSLMWFFIPTFFVLGVLFAASTVSAFVGTITEQGASRSVGSTYQNTDTEDMIIFVSLSGGAGDSAEMVMRMGTASASDNVAYCSAHTTSTNENCQLTMVIPPNYYYGVFVLDNTAPAISDIEWWEYVTPADETGGAGGGGASDETLLGIQSQTNLFYGFVLFFIFMMFPIWLFRRK